MQCSLKHNLLDLQNVVKWEWLTPPLRIRRSSFRARTGLQAPPRPNIFQSKQIQHFHCHQLLKNPQNIHLTAMNTMALCPTIMKTVGRLKLRLARPTPSKIHYSNQPLPLDYYLGGVVDANASNKGETMFSYKVLPVEDYASQAPGQSQYLDSYPVYRADTDTSQVV